MHDFEPAGPLPQKSGALPVTHHISYRPQTKRPTTAGSTGQGTNLENTSKTNSFVLVCFLTSTLCKAGGHSCYHSHQWCASKKISLMWTRKCWTNDWLLDDGAKYIGDIRHLLDTSHPKQGGPHNSANKWRLFYFKYCRLKISSLRNVSPRQLHKDPCSAR